MMTSEPLRAACLTPPAPGGVAVIRLAGPGAARLLAPHLRARRPIDPETADPSTLRLCRLVDGEEVIDDVIMAVGRDRRGAEVVDLSLHGGPRIVHRALRLLAAAGAELVEPAALRPWRDAADSAVIETAYELLPAARTPAAALWMLQAGRAFSAALKEAHGRILSGDTDGAAGLIDRLCRHAPAARRMIGGARIVLIGPPNAGKSTLANALADAGRAIVCDRPGTTRDWTEHAGSLDGIPCDFVDTAGLCDPQDAIEAEAVRRTAEQARRADLLLEVFDGSAAPGAADPVDRIAAGLSGLPTLPRVRVLNKSDLGCAAGWDADSAAGPEAIVRVSALTGAGLDELKQAIRRELGLEDPAAVVGPFTADQHRRCEAIRAMLAAVPPDPAGAAEAVASLLTGA